MNADLKLCLSNNLYLILEENMSLEDIDTITTKYNDFYSFINSNEYESVINSFYKQYSNYIDKIEDGNKKFGYLKIDFGDDNLDYIDILYKNDSNKLNSKKLLNSIKRTLLDVKDSDLILKLSGRIGFFLDSDFNYKKGLAKYRRNISNFNSFGDYRKLTLMIYNEVNKKDEDKKYIYTRVIDSFINYKGYKTMKSRIKINKKNIDKIGDSKLVKDNKLDEKLIGIGTKRYLDYITYYDESFENNEDEYIIDIDPFSFEEKDDEDTWFR